MAGNPVLDPTIAPVNWKQGDALHILRGIYIELRTQTAILAAGLNQEPLLDQLRADPTAVLPDATNTEFSDASVAYGTS